VPSSPRPTPTGTPTASDGATRPPGDPTATDLVTGLTTPWGLALLPDGGALVSERDNRTVKLVRDGAATVLTTLDAVEPKGEGGLLGLAFTPDRDRLLAYYTSDQDNRIVSLSWDGTRLGPPSVILDGIPKAGRHNGGRMVVGPDDLLYVGTGDAGDSGLAQDKGSLGGKILRLRLDGRPAAGNPFGSAVWSFGHRNVQGLAFDPAGRLWASEFGDQTWDEINLVSQGANYGWPEAEGDSAQAGFTDPKVVWDTSDASPSGLAYWQGSLWMAALRGERLWEIPVSGDRVGTPRGWFGERYGRLRTVAVAVDGQSLWLGSSNTDGRGSENDGDDRLMRVTLA
jgi:glucose/arabinose dehydrogenase